MNNLPRKAGTIPLSEGPETQVQTAELVSWAERIIQQSQYAMLDVLRPKAISPLAESIRAGDVACLFKISELVFSTAEGSQERLSTILNSLHACGASCLMLLECQNGRSELYLGAVNKKRYDNVFFLNTIREALRIGIEGNLPGTELEELRSRQDIQEKLEECIGSGFDSQCITAISCVASDQKQAGAPLHGLERLLEAIGNRNFTLMVLADPVDPESMKKVRQGYEALGSQLAQMEHTSVSTQSGTSITRSESESRSVSDSWSRNISMTQSYTEGTGWSSSVEDAQAKLRKLAGATAGIVTGNFAVSYLFGNNQNSQSGHRDQSQSKSEGETQGTQSTIQTGTGQSVADSQSTTLGYTTTDYHIKNLRERVDWYLQWLNRRENLGMFNSCAYVISSSASINLMVASQFQALMQGEGDMNQPITINTWSQDSGVETIRQSLLHLSHPVFSYKNMDENFTPAVLQSSKELSRQMALPQKSVVGITVTEYAPFGREVVRKVPLRNGKILRIGCVSHMGKASREQPVVLDIQSLAAHTFVAGTNGSGKSNTIFRMLEGLQEAGIPFLVIEPAKGEYKNIFGHDADVHVYGTNLQQSDLLQINPFWFNEDVNVLEHIDRLLSVFNASWSMYAAMPAVLKAAIESAYRACGWDLKRSVCRGSVRIFPTVQDVLEQFNGKMDSTAFSQEVKGNYVGALSTRMESLCNGIYGEIFGGCNCPDEALFDQNVIIDLSRVGSAETKSMLMGILLIRLQEYRTRHEAMNLPLRHITVLEEAHHLLKRTSSAQSDEGSNLLGKSVEMISTAIAEMRSYGEGFIIVDQSPGLLDLSVMRNTNTKIILRLPEAGDRELVGNTMGLNPEQMYEISRFKTGLCVAYQQNWLEAVLCQVDRAGHEGRIFRKASADSPDLIWRRRIVQALLGPFVPGAAGAVFGEEDRQAIAQCGLPGMVKRRLLAHLSQPGREPDWAAVRQLVFDTAGRDLLPPEQMDLRGAQEWYRELLQDEELRHAWGENYLPLVLKCQVQGLAAQQEEWAAVLRLLPDLQAQADSRLKRHRGLAFRRVCPLGRLDESLSAQELEAARLALNQSEAPDQALSELLRRHMDAHTVRERGVIQPYANVIWNLLDGQALWDQLAGRLQSKDLEAWDQAARAALRQVVSADRDTETSILSLYLQRKGALPEVRAFYPLWMGHARGRME